MSASDLAKLTAAANGRESVRKPSLMQHDRCWAVVKERAYDRHSRWFPRYVNCGHLPRKGCLTCATHKDREEEAQALKAKEITP